MTQVTIFESGQRRQSTALFRVGEMLTKLKDRYGVSSDEGFVVDRTGSPLTQFIMRYREGRRTLEYPLENLVPGSVTPVVLGSIKMWNSPHNMEQLSLDKRLEIAERIKDAMEFLGDKSSVIV
jgi:hypothetical protein